MVPPAFSSPPLIFAKAFPVHLVFRKRETEIIHLGDVLARICPELSLGSSLKEHFRIERPKIPVEFDVIREKSDSMFLNLIFLRKAIYCEISPDCRGQSAL